MNLDIILSDDNKRGIVNLKSFIDKADIEGIDSTEIKRADHADGQMGAGDILNSVKTIIEAAVSPVDHKYELPPLAVNVALPPVQIVAGFIVTTGAELTVTVPVFVAEQPAEEVPVTE